MGNSIKYNRKAIAGILAILVFGTSSMVVSKMMLDTRACPRFDEKQFIDIKPWSHRQCPKFAKLTFEKVWYKTVLVFISFSLCFPGYLYELYQQKKQQSLADETQPLMEQSTTQHGFDRRVYLLCIIPGTLELVANTLMTYGLIYIDVSIMQMLRGAMVIFCTLFSKWFLKRQILTFQWISVAVTMTSLILVGLSCLLGSTIANPWNQQLLGCFLVLLGTVFQAVCVVYEDYMMGRYSSSALQVVTFKGFWGLALTCCVCWPLVSFVIPGSDHGHVEDIDETFYMMNDNTVLWVYSVVYVLSVQFRNWGAMVVTKETNSIVRSLFDVIRCALIWISNLVLFVAIPNSIFGERWTTWSWIQLAGFVLLAFSSQVYSAYVKFPIFKYVARE